MANKARDATKLALPGFRHLVEGRAGRPAQNGIPVFAGEAKLGLRLLAMAFGRLRGPGAPELKSSSEAGGRSPGRVSGGDTSGAFRSRNVRSWLNVLGPPLPVSDLVTGGGKKKERKQKQSWGVTPFLPLFPRFFRSFVTTSG